MKTVFDISPEDIIFRMRDHYIGEINAGSQEMLNNLLPYLETQAIKGLKSEEPSLKAYEPLRKDGFDTWRYFWLNEARHNSNVHTAVPVAGDHLSPKAQACTNVLTIASELRSAIDAGNAELSSALSMLLICEVFSGGLWPEMEKSHSAQKRRYEKGAGEQSQIIGRIRRGVMKRAAERWKVDPSIRMGEMVNELYDLIQQKKSDLAELRYPPTKGTLREWLKAEGKEGTLRIPAEAQRAGRKAAA